MNLNNALTKLTAFFNKLTKLLLPLVIVSLLLGIIFGPTTPFVGDVYKGKVVKVLPGMQAAFIDIGLDRAAFVHVSDLSVGTEPGDVLVDSVEDDKGPELPRPRAYNLR